MPVFFRILFPKNSPGEVIGLHSLWGLSGAPKPENWHWGACEPQSLTTLSAPWTEPAEPKEPGGLPEGLEVLMAIPAP